MNFDEACRRMLGQEPETVIEWFDSDPTIPDAIRSPELRPKTLNCYAAGLWLHDALAKKGVPEQDVSDACESGGQMMVFRDPWKVVSEQYHRVIDEGLVVIPGPDLASALIYGHGKLKGRPRSDR